MAMTLRLDNDDDAALAATAAREHLSKHEVVVRAVRAYTSGRQQRLDAAIERVATRDAEALRRLGE
jgi:predicted transcriptional regulator